VALVVFRSKAAGEFFMLPENAKQIFDILGRPMEARGVLTAEQLPAAIAALDGAIERQVAEPAADSPAAAAAATDNGDDAAREAAQRVSLRQRAFPLLQMMRAASAKGVDVTWGV